MATVTIPDDLAARLRALAEDAHTTADALATDALAESVERSELAARLWQAVADVDAGRTATFTLADLDARLGIEGAPADPSALDFD